MCWPAQVVYSGIELHTVGVSMTLPLPPSPLSEIAYRTRTVLEFDPKTETITNSKEAHAMLTKEYREPYGLPSRV